MNQDVYINTVTTIIKYSKRKNTAIVNILSSGSIILSRNVIRARGVDIVMQNHINKIQERFF